MASAAPRPIALPRTPLFEALAAHDRASTAVVHSASGKTFTYASLLADVDDVRARLAAATGAADLREQRVALLIENGYEYVGAPARPPAPAAR